MALKMNASAQVVFFEQVFGKADKVVAAVKYLVGIGVTIDQALFALTAKKGDKKHSVTLSAGTTPLVKKTLPEPVLHNNKVIIRGFVNAALKLFAPDQVANFGLLASLELPTIDKFADGGEFAVGGGVPWDTPLPVSESTDAADFAVVLETKGTNLITTIKLLRVSLGWSLKDSKNAVDTVPCVIAKGVTQAFVADLCESLGKAGCKLSIFKVSELSVVPKFATQHVPAVDHSQIKFFAGAHLIDNTNAAIQNQAADAHAFDAILQTPVNDVIALRDAKALGQKVRGTSPGTVYYAVATGARFNVGARIQADNTVSLRLEVTGTKATPAELAAIKNLGFKWAGEYGSIHVHTTPECPVAGIIGNILFRLGIRFAQQVTFAGDLVVEK